MVEQIKEQDLLASVYSIKVNDTEYLFENGKKKLFPTIKKAYEYLEGQGYVAITEEDRDYASYMDNKNNTYQPHCHIIHVKKWIEDVKQDD